MLKSLISLFLLVPPAQAPAADCACKSVSGIQKSGRTSSSMTYIWQASEDATQYKVWYYHEECETTSDAFFTTIPGFTFANLEPGCHVLYFVAICGGESRGFIGVNDIVHG